MVAITRVTPKLDIRASQQLQAVRTELETNAADDELVNHTRSLLVKIVSSVESDDYTTWLKTQRDEIVSQAANFRDRILFSLADGLINAFGTNVDLNELDSSYDPADFRKHENGKLLKVLHYLEETGLVRITYESLSKYTGNRQDQRTYVPNTVAPTKLGRAYVHSLGLKN